jgi:hypothetical protein
MNDVSGLLRGAAGMVGQTGIAVNLALRSWCARDDGPEEGEVVCGATDANVPPVPHHKNLLSLIELA